MTAHADVEVYYHKTFTTNPTDAQVDSWCTAVDLLVTQMGSALSTAIKTFLTCQAILQSILTDYRKRSMNAGAESTGEKDGTFQFNVINVIKFLKDAILALETCGDHVTFEVPGNS